MISGRYRIVNKTIYGIIEAKQWIRLRRMADVRFRSGNAVKIINIPYDRI